MGLFDKKLSEWNLKDIIKAYFVFVIIGIAIVSIIAIVLFVIIMLFLCSACSRIGCIPPQFTRLYIHKQPSME